MVKLDEKQEPTVTTPVPLPYRRSPLTSNVAITVMSLGVFFGVWTYLGTTMNPVIFASPKATWDRMVILVQSGDLSEAWGESLFVLFTGLVAAAVLGVSLALLFGRVRFLRELFSPPLAAIFMTPGVALVPIISLWLGWGDSPKVVVTILFAFFPVYYTSLGGIRAIDNEFEEISVAYSVTGRRLITKIVVPAALPYVITALRLGLLHGMVGVVLGGFFLETSGIGGLLNHEASSFRMGSVFAVLITVAAVGITINEGLQYAERRLVPWKAREFA